MLKAFITRQLVIEIRYPQRLVPYLLEQYSAQAMTNKNHRASTFPSRLSLTLNLMQKLASKVVNLGCGFREGNNGIVSISEYSCLWEVIWQKISKPHTAVLSPGPKFVPAQSVNSEETLNELSQKTLASRRRGRYSMHPSSSDPLSMSSHNPVFSRTLFLFCHAGRLASMFMTTGARSRRR